MSIFTLSFLVIVCKIYVVGAIIAVIINSFVLGYKQEDPSLTSMKSVALWPIYFIAMFGILFKYYRTKNKKGNNEK